MKKATSKIKEVVRTKDYTNTHGTTIYHDLVMDNGDKIQIGKKKLQEVGWELSYEITDEGQEYNKAKSIKPEEVNGTATSSSYQSKDTGVITMLSCISSACTAVAQSSKAIDTAYIQTMAENFFNLAMSKSTK